MRTQTPRMNYRQIVALSHDQLKQMANTPGHIQAVDASAELARRYPPTQPQGMLATPPTIGS